MNIILVGSAEALDILNKNLEEKLQKISERLELINNLAEKTFFNVIYAFYGDITVITSKKLEVLIYFKNNLNY